MEAGRTFHFSEIVINETQIEDENYILILLEFKWPLLLRFSRA